MNVFKLLYYLQLARKQLILLKLLYFLSHKSIKFNEILKKKGFQPEISPIILVRHVKNKPRSNKPIKATDEED